MHKWMSKLGTLGAARTPDRDAAGSAPAFPYFIAVEPRPLSDLERAVVTRLLAEQDSQYQMQVPNLSVVGRCGCGACPTVFFQTHTKNSDERFLAPGYNGRDASGGLVGAFLSESMGRLHQLDMYSVDGHDPWTIPDAETLEPQQD